VFFTVAASSAGLLQSGPIDQIPYAAQTHTPPPRGENARRLRSLSGPTFLRGWQRPVHSLLRRRRPVRRCAALYGAGLAACLGAWTLSYHCLPEGIMRGRTGAALLAGDEAADTFLLEFVRILVINAVVAVLLVFIPNRLLIVGRLPLGYWP